MACKFCGGLFACTCVPKAERTGGAEAAVSVRLCVTCRHFNLIGSEPDYSEMTPGSDGSIWCMKAHFAEPDKRHWKNPPRTAEIGLNEILDLRHFREIIGTARECQDYEEASE